MNFFFYRSNNDRNEVWLCEHFDSVCIEDLDHKRHLFVCKQVNDNGQEMDGTHQ